MNKSEIALLLGTAAVYDKRTIGDADVHAWYEAIGDLDHEDARRAVIAHYGSSTEWIRPGHVRERVRAARTTRLGRTLEPPPEDPDDVEAYIWQLRSVRQRIAAPAPPGTPAVTSPQRRGGPPPEGVRSGLEAARAACAQASASRGTGEDGELTDAERAARERARAAKAASSGGGAERLGARDMRGAVEELRRAEAERERS